MSNDQKQRLLLAVFRVLKPIASIFLKAGLGYVHLDEIFRLAFVDVATNEFGLRGRQTNVSRVAILTGITRKEVGRLRKVDGLESLDWERVAIIPELVLNEWRDNPRFVDQDGEASPLAYKVGENSFCDLVKEVGGDVPPGAVKSELLRLGAISIEPDGLLRLEKKVLSAGGMSEESVNSFEFGLSRMLETISFNCRPTRTRPTFYQRIVDSNRIPLARRAEVEKLLKAELTALADRYAQSMDAAVSPPKKEDDEVRQIGIGCYYFPKSDVE